MTLDGKVIAIIIVSIFILISLVISFFSSAEPCTIKRNIQNEYNSILNKEGFTIVNEDNIDNNDNKKEEDKNEDEDDDDEGYEDNEYNFDNLKGYKPSFKQNDSLSKIEHFTVSPPKNKKTWSVGECNKQCASNCLSEIKRLQQKKISKPIQKTIQKPINKKPLNRQQQTQPQYIEQRPPVAIPQKQQYIYLSQPYDEEYAELPYIEQPVPQTTILQTPISQVPTPITQVPTPITQVPTPITQIPAPITQIPAPITQIPAPITQIPASITQVPTVPITQIPASIAQVPTVPIAQVPSAQTTPIVPVIPTTGMNVIENAWITEHNRIRANLGLKPVKWNQEIADGAAKYASNCQFQHSQQNTRMYGSEMLGENLSMGSPVSMYDDTKMVQLWEDEKKNYTYPQGPSESQLGQTGHYTQIINKNVTEIGCGCATCGTSRMCVCRYLPIQYGGEPPY